VGGKTGRYNSTEYEHPEDPLIKGQKEKRPRSEALCRLRDQITQPRVERDDRLHQIVFVAKERGRKTAFKGGEPISKVKKPGGKGLAENRRHRRGREL